MRTSKISPKVLQASILCLLTLTPACMATTTTATTWPDPSAPGYQYRGGRVDSVQEIVQRTEGNPAGGALAGAVVGALLFGGRGPGALVGAAGGAAVGASASQGASENRTYQVVVHFDDGTYATFAYGGYTPFRPGERVVLTPQGLARG
jgi:outer membrane lipoprotein SlyB